MYTILMIGINISGRTATNLLLPGELETLTPDDIELRIYGSKIVILLEQAMLIVTWGIKGCMILMYHRLTSRLNMQIVIKAIAGYIVIGFVAVELAWFLSCRPFKGYWMLPVPMVQCATYQHYSITQATFNITSDLMMLAVGIPLLLKAKVELKKKIILVGIFSCGVFVILAACLNKYYNFSNPFTTIYMLWYIRESSTAIYVSNLPMLWPLFRRLFNVGKFADHSSGQKYAHSDGEPLSVLSRKKPGTGTRDTMSFAGSEERINKGAEEGVLEIEQRFSFSIEKGEVDVELGRGEGPSRMGGHKGSHTTTISATR
ncbi:hypothetical protein P167DRAFT_537565 [Morchella conica CCBAS932]|uniref:Rhodopsin domain-containing protein n=1 Tax=Morchella conica CCBAS932 TaxID=1392247 RepID=A0A3N4KIJ0_9PEZI|nr:hypothetical protein P167DRAFT_537565 [Morchella conica CCBAS932]